MMGPEKNSTGHRGLLDAGRKPEPQHLEEGGGRRLQRLEKARKQLPSPLPPLPPGASRKALSPADILILA